MSRQCVASTSFENFIVVKPFQISNVSVGELGIKHILASSTVLMILSQLYFINFSDPRIFSKTGNLRIKMIS